MWVWPRSSGQTTTRSACASALRSKLRDIPCSWKRNANWVKALDTLVRTEPGTYFVAVGAAHLTGKDSVLEKLKPLGYAAERIE